MAIPIDHRARGAIHEKKPASNAKKNETAANAVIALLAASPAPMKIPIPARPTKKAKIENAMLIPIQICPAWFASFLLGFSQSGPTGDYAEPFPHRARLVGLMGSLSHDTTFFLQLHTLASHHLLVVCSFLRIAIQESVAGSTMKGKRTRLEQLVGSKI